MNQKNIQSNDDHRQKIKKPLPPYWNLLKHPSINSTRLKLPNESLESLTDQQRKTYDYLFNTLNSPDFNLPAHKNLSSSTSNNHQSIHDQLPTQDDEDLSLSESEKAFCSRECLLRFCRATRWDPNRALKRCIDTLVWRREFGVDRLDFRDLFHEAETGKLFTLGYNQHQRPLLYMFPYRENTKSSVDQIKLVVWYLERTIDLMPPGVETVTLIIDFGDRTRSSKSYNALPISISTAKEVLRILQTYYGERLAQAICVNVPWIFGSFLKILKPLMDPKTSEKILLDPIITDYVPREQLLKDTFGGDFDFQYDHESYFPLLAELAAHRRQRMLARYRRSGKGMIGMTEFELRGTLRRVKGQTRDPSLGSSSTDTSFPVPRSNETIFPSSQPNSRQYTHPSSSANPSEQSDRIVPLVTFQSSSSNPKQPSRSNDQDLVAHHPSPSDGEFGDSQTRQTLTNWQGLEGSSSLQGVEPPHHSELRSIRASLKVASYASRPLSFVEPTSSFDLKKVHRRSRSPRSDQNGRLKTLRYKLSCRSASQESPDGPSEVEDREKMEGGRIRLTSSIDGAVHHSSRRRSSMKSRTWSIGHPPQSIKDRSNSPPMTLDLSLDYRGLAQVDEASFSRRVHLISS